MAFPVLNMLSFSTTLVAYMVILAAFFVVGGAPLHGWTGYPPMSAIVSSGPGRDWALTLDHRRDFLRGVADGCAELYYHQLFINFADGINHCLMVLGFSMRKIKAANVNASLYHGQQHIFFC